ncbi:hypothetical protein Tco_0396217 [Tanacetum coccineum]
MVIIMNGGEVMLGLLGIDDFVLGDLDPSFVDDQGLSRPLLRDTLGYPVHCYGILWVIPSSVTGFFGLSRPSLRDTLGYPV